MSSLLDTPPPASSAASYFAVVGTIAAHGLVVVLASHAGVRGVSDLKDRLFSVTELVEVALPEAPVLPAPVTPPAPAPVTAPPRIKVASPTPTPPAPAAAQAGQVLDAPSEVVDFGDTIVTGSGDSYGGGTTERNGTSTGPVRDVSARGEGPVPALTPKPRPVDLTRPPQLAGSAQWQCPFPVEADDAGIDHAVVTLRVEVRADGGVRNVTAVADPGNGFGREARRCAGSKRWVAGLDRAGHAVDASATVNVRFDR